MAAQPCIENLMVIVEDLKREGDGLREKVLMERRRRAELERILEEIQDRIKRRKIQKEEKNNNLNRKKANLDNLRERSKNAESTYQAKRHMIGELEEMIQKEKENIKKSKLLQEEEFENWLQKFKDLKLAYSPVGIKCNQENLKIELQSVQSEADELEKELTCVNEKLLTLQSGLSANLDIDGVGVEKKQYVKYICQEENWRLVKELDVLKKKVENISAEIENHSH